MTIKYEPVFGDQSLFDNAPEDAEYAGWFCQDIRWYTISNGKILFSDGGTWCTSDNPYLSADIAAMRRVIKTPTWTCADQEAGVLPPVGVKCLWVDKSGVPGEGHAVLPKVGTEVEIIAHYTNIKTIAVFIWVDEDGDTVNSCSCEIYDFSPIETPEEKAERVKSQWLKTANNVFRGTMVVDDLREIYDALLSGELKAPTND